MPEKTPDCSEIGSVAANDRNLSVSAIELLSDFLSPEVVFRAWSLADRIDEMTLQSAIIAIFVR